MSKQPLITRKQRLVRLMHRCLLPCFALCSPVFFYCHFGVAGEQVGIADNACPDHPLPQHSAVNRENDQRRAHQWMGGTPSDEAPKKRQDNDDRDSVQ